ncbi:MAG: hypothetical protein LBH29_00685, partial [Elusimicrobiota bacterium]|jgi:hypothetical protein|nr:hypothetical protein [Elusimicrobiota bacterium]
LALPFITGTTPAVNQRIDAEVSKLLLPIKQSRTADMESVKSGKTYIPTLFLIKINAEISA